MYIGVSFHLPALGVSLYSTFGIPLGVQGISLGPLEFSLVRWEFPLVHWRFPLVHQQFQSLAFVYNTFWNTKIMATSNDIIEFSEQKLLTLFAEVDRLQKWKPTTGAYCRCGFIHDSKKFTPRFLATEHLYTCSFQTIFRFLLTK